MLGKYSGAEINKLRIPERHKNDLFHSFYLRFIYLIYLMDVLPRAKNV